MKTKSAILFIPLIILSVILFLLCVVFAIRAYINEGFDHIPQIKEDDAAFVIYEELHPRENVTQFLLADGTIYILFEKYGIVNVYTLDGNYKYTYHYYECLYDKGRGKAEIAYKDGIFYLESRDHIIHQFSGSTYLGIRQFKKSERQQYIDFYNWIREDDQHEHAGTKYFVYDNALHSSTDGELNVVVSFPKINEEIKWYFFFLTIPAALTGTLWEEWRFRRMKEKSTADKTGNIGDMGNSSES